jgi:DNA-binding XRE family transcriptional regulator
MEQYGDVIRRRSRELGLSQTALAESAGVHVRQIRRYERGEQQPALNVAVRIAATLGITLDELAGVAGPRVTLDGTWWAARHVVLDGHGVVVAVPVALTQHGSTVAVEAQDVRRGPPWRGELRLWSGPTLTGWYGAEGDVRSRGTMFFVLGEDEVALGRWVGLDVNGAIATGHASLARTREGAQAGIARLAA